MRPFYFSRQTPPTLMDENELLAEFITKEYAVLFSKTYKEIKPINRLFFYIK